MTDDKLREASERVAKRWLNADLLWNGWLGNKELRILPCDLYGPYGMDLLLDAVEEKGFGYRINGEPGPESYFVKVEIFIGLRIAKCVNKNRYVALIFALDKAGEVL